MKPILCIYHGNCADGFGAAWVVRRYCQQNNYPVEFFPGFYGKEPPDVTDRNVIMVDFSYKRPVLLKMAEQAASILILDHHKTAAEDLVDLPLNVNAVFDTNRSGAMIAWDHYNPGEKPYPLIEYIQDRDLWRKRLPGSEDVSASIFSYPYDFEVWDTLAQTEMSTLRREGEVITRKHMKDLKELLAVTKRRMVIAGTEVWVANLPYTMASDAGAILGAGGEPFAGTYYDGPKARYFSLRSAEDGVDVSTIAAQFGGGGHAHAAGFQVPRDHELARS